TPLWRRRWGRIHEASFSRMERGGGARAAVVIASVSRAGFFPVFANSFDVVDGSASAGGGRGNGIGDYLPANRHFGGITIRALQRGAGATGQGTLAVAGSGVGGNPGGGRPG